MLFSYQQLFLHLQKKTSLSKFEIKQFQLKMGNQLHSIFSLFLSVKICVSCALLMRGCQVKPEYGPQWVPSLENPKLLARSLMQILKKQLCCSHYYISQSLPNFPYHSAISSLIPVHFFHNIYRFLVRIECVLCFKMITCR